MEANDGAAGAGDLEMKDIMEWLDRQRYALNPEFNS